MVGYCLGLTGSGSKTEVGSGGIYPRGRELSLPVSSILINGSSFHPFVTQAGRLSHLLHLHRHLHPRSVSHHSLLLTPLNHLLNLCSALIHAGPAFVAPSFSLTQDRVEHARTVESDSRFEHSSSSYLLCSVGLVS